MAVMLNVTDLADGCPFTQHTPFNFLLYNQTVAPTFSADFLWHISCDVSSRQNMKNYPDFCEFEFSVFHAGRIRKRIEENYKKLGIRLKVSGNLQREVRQMNKSLLVRLALLLLIVSTLSGCIWAVEDDGHGRGGGGGEHRGGEHRGGEHEGDHH